MSSWTSRAFPVFCTIVCGQENSALNNIQRAIRPNGLHGKHCLVNSQ